MRKTYSINMELLVYPLLARLFVFMCVLQFLLRRAKKSYVSIWQTIGIGVWSVALGAAFHYGVNLLEYLPNLNPFS